MDQISNWLDSISQSERQQIASVLEQDLALQLQLQQNIARARGEYQNVRQQSAISDCSNGDSQRHCARCQNKLGIFFDSGQLCPKCRQTVCKNCFVASSNKNRLLCIVCEKNREYLAASGEWMQERNVNEKETQKDPLSPMLVSAAILTEIQKKSALEMAKKQSPALSSSPRHLRKSPEKKTGNKAMNIVRKLSPRHKEEKQGKLSRSSGFLAVPEDPDRPIRSLSNVSVSLERSPSVPHQLSKEYASPNFLSPSDAASLNRAASTGNVNLALGKKLSAPVFSPVTVEEESKGSRRTKSMMDSNSRTSTSERTDVSGSFTTTDTLHSVQSCQSLCSLPLDDGAAMQGQVLIHLDYNCRLGALEVHVIQAKDLTPVDAKKMSADPYVKTYLLPDRSSTSKKKTRVKRHTLEPHFKEVLRYTGLTKSELEERTLLVSVWHNDLMGHNLFLGETRIPLSDYPWISDGVQGFWYPLSDHQADPPPDPTQPPSYCGEISFSIKFVPPDVTKGERGQGSLHCLIWNAQELICPRQISAFAPFVKAYLYPDKKKQTKQKSAVAKGQEAPTWNHTFVFDGQTTLELREKSVELTLWDHHLAHSNTFLGGLRLNLGTGLCRGRQVHWMDSTEQEQRVWLRVLERPNSWVEARLPLRSSMASRNST